jgi:hypothetical protein
MWQVAGANAYRNPAVMGCWCAEARKPVELTRSRAYKSNDQAWMKQKNGYPGLP